MAVCDYCDHEMLTGVGCTDAPIVIRGRSYLPVRHGNEGRFGWTHRPPRCHDCRVAAGDVHHHGCDMEECPACGEQSISCGCRWAGEEEDGDDWEEEWATLSYGRPGRGDR